MDIFIAWSGDAAKLVASKLREWLPCVLQASSPWMSEDIGKGTRWNNEIALKLDASSFGIICLTKSSARSPWVLFESGALAKSFDGESNSRITPLLVGLDPAAIPSPLRAFEATHTTREDVARLVADLNKSLESPLLPENLAKVFDKFWPELEETLATAVDMAEAEEDDPKDETTSPETSPDALLRELLEVSWSNQREIQNLDRNIGVLAAETKHRASRSTREVRQRRERPPNEGRLDATTDLLVRFGAPLSHLETRGDSLFVRTEDNWTAPARLVSELDRLGWGHVSVNGSPLLGGSVHGAPMDPT